MTALANDTPAPTGVQALAPPRLELSPPWPNPARAGGTVTVRLGIARHELLALALYDVAGRRVWERGERAYAPGVHTVTLALSFRGAGLHFLEIRAGTSGSAVRRLTLLD